jgi:hypothetical protein
MNIDWDEFLRIYLTDNDGRWGGNKTKETT